MSFAWFEDARKRYKITRELPQYWSFPEHQFGYIQIPKAATRSIRAALMDVCGVAEEGFDSFEGRFSAHVPLTQVRKDAPGKVIFAFVRNPYARLYSAYVNKIVDAERSGGKNIFRCHGMRFGMGFEEFVDIVCAIDDAHVDRHLRSQSWFLADSNGIVPSFIGRLETFAQDWERLRVALPVLGPVGHKNKAAGEVDYRQFYSERALAMVFERYRNDFELFGYGSG